MSSFSIVSETEGQPRDTQGAFEISLPRVAQKRYSIKDWFHESGDAIVWPGHIWGPLFGLALIKGQLSFGQLFVQDGSSFTVAIR